ncbi:MULTISPECIES: hypothetical protein [Streptomyces]|uniref:hypothetical protein n=1 Tax=Streptomyces TaxID=1883 RepID=UPI0008247CD6|nr:MULTISPECIES: hypothetical protein [Streptomyces]MBW8090862.1 hypothetical protein [Streptomyces hygroscopicus subsp. hygroscopicus]MCO8301584.1 hypothetical protein [Streptomyces sp. RKCA744]
MYVRRDMVHSPAGCVFRDYRAPLCVQHRQDPGGRRARLAELRLIDQDAYVVMTPGFDKCDASKPTIKCHIR